MRSHQRSAVLESQLDKHAACNHSLHITLCNTKHATHSNFSLPAKHSKQYTACNQIV